MAHSLDSRALGIRSMGLALALAAACSGGSDDRPPASAETGGSSRGGTKTTAHSGSSSQSQGGADAGQPSAAGGDSRGGEGSEGGEGIMYQSAGAPSFTPGDCDPQLTLGRARALGVPGGALLAMTPDELTVAFTTGDPPDLVLHVGDRADADQAFDDAVVPIPEGYEVSSGAALASNGLGLILVLKSHEGFGALSRSDRSQPFAGEADVSAFVRVNAAKAMSGRALGWPVLSSDGRDLYYLSYFGEGHVEHSALAADDVFDIGLDVSPFTGEPDAYQLPQGLSVDQRTLFYFDQATQHAMARFRPEASRPFSEVLDLGERLGAAPNLDCSRIYSAVGGQLVVQAVE